MVTTRKVRAQSGRRGNGYRSKEPKQSRHSTVTRELLIIRHIDKTILSLEYRQLFPLIRRVLRRLPSIIPEIDAASLYIRRGNHFVPGDQKLALASLPRLGPVETVLKDFPIDANSLTLREGSSISAETELDSRRLALYPLYYPDDYLLGIFTLRTSPDETPLHRELSRSSQESLIRILSQLQLAFRTLYNRRIELLVESLWEFILDEYTTASSGFEYLASHLRHLLPDFPPLRLTERPYVNLLAFNSGEGQLTIRGATEAITTNVPVFLDRSITGSLVRSAEVDILNVSPRDDPRYGSLYSKYSSGKTLPLVEVAMKLSERGKVRGVINIEYFKTADFSSTHEVFVKALQRKLSLLFVALEARWQNDLQTSRGQGASTQAYLNTFAKALRHELMQFTVAISSRVDSTARSSDPKELRAALREIRIVDEKIVMLVNQFAKDAAAMSVETFVGAKDLFVKLRRFFMAGKRLDAQRAPFDILIKVPRATEIYTSRLLEIFVNAMFENSFTEFLGKHEADKTFVGLVQVVHHERVINTNQYSIEYDLIEVLDNGRGVSQAKLKELQNGEQVTSERGLGYALSGLSRYMREQGGFVELDSVEGKSFSVRLGFRRRR